MVNCQLGQDLEKLLAEKHVTLAYQEDLVDVLWKERPKQSAEPVWILEEKYSGKTSALKIEELRSQMKKEKATIHILTTLDDIAWLLNIRGNDVECNPVVLSYAMITLDRFYLFINEKVLKAEVKAYFKDLSVTICPYNDIYTVVSQLRDQKVLVETGKTNYAIVKKS